MKSILIITLLLMLPLTIISSEKYVEISMTDFAENTYENSQQLPYQITLLNNKKVKITYASCFFSKDNKNKLFITSPAASVNIAYGQKISPAETIIGYFQSNKSISKKALNQLITFWGVLRLENSYDNSGNLISLFKLEVEGYTLTNGY